MNKEENEEIKELTDIDIYDFNHLSLKINELVRAVNKLNKDLNEITNIHKEVNKRITDK